jgi:tryptophan-rich sensory protein
MSITMFLIFFAATCAAGATGALFPTGAWYKSLNKPAWTPPNWAFPVMWTSIYLLISFAGARVALLDGNQFAMGFWALQIALNALWTPVFFGLRRLKGSLPIMGCLWLAVLGATITHLQLDLWAGLAFMPYLIWVSIAGALNLAMVQLNPDQAPLAIHDLP